MIFTTLHIVGDVTTHEQGITMRPEYEIIGEESCGRIDYAIKVTIASFPVLFFSYV